MDPHKILEEARHLLGFELAHELWKAPTKAAERLEAYEARHAQIVERLRALLGAFQQQAAPAPAAEPEQAALQPEQPAAAPPATKPKHEARADDLTDDLDSPAF